MTSSTLRRTFTAAAAAAGTAVLLLAAATGASAHVGISPDKTSANSYALLTFGIPHGCEESGTTKVTITLPAELNDAQPTVNPSWLNPRSWPTARPSPSAPARSFTRPKRPSPTTCAMPWCSR
jgi:hypothetical protein